MLLLLLPHVERIHCYSALFFFSFLPKSINSCVSLGQQRPLFGSFGHIKSPLDFVCRWDHPVKAIWSHIQAKAVKDRESCRGVKENVYTFQKTMGANVGQGSYLIGFGNLINLASYRQ